MKKAEITEAKRQSNLRYKRNNPNKIIHGQARQRAIRDGLEFNLELSDIVIPETCPVLGIELKRSEGRQGPTDNSPTLDRIHPKIGYIKGNVIIISGLANKIKSSANYRQILSVGRWLKGLTNSQMM